MPVPIRPGYHGPHHAQDNNQQDTDGCCQQQIGPLVFDLNFACVRPASLNDWSNRRNLDGGRRRQIRGQSNGLFSRFRLLTRAFNPLEDVRFALLCFALGERSAGGRSCLRNRLFLVLLGIDKLDLQFQCADLDPITGFQNSAPLDFRAVDERPHRAATVLNGNGFLIDYDLAMNVIDGIAFWPEMAFFALADHERRRRDGEFRPRFLSADHDQLDIHFLLAFNPTDLPFVDTTIRSARFFTSRFISGFTLQSIFVQCASARLPGWRDGPRIRVPPSFQDVG
jgi:hypothetical protein